MAATTELNILIKLRDEASQALGKVGNQLQGLAKATEPALMASKAVAGGLLAIGAAGIAGGTMAINAARDTMKVQNQLAAVLKSTGHAAGLTAEDINEHAAALSRLTNFEDDAIVSAQNLLLTFTNIKGPVFQQATETMLDMAAAMGTDASGGAIQLGKALNDPVAGISALSRVGVTFTDSQKKMIEEMVKAGKTADAQKVILKELATEFGGSAKAQLDPITKLKQSFGELFEQVGLKILPAVNALAEKALNFTTNVLPVWIDRSKEIIQWLKEHQWVVLSVAGAILGALVPSIAALLPVVWEAVTAFAASAVALAPFIIGGAIVGGIVAGVIWIVKHWDMIKEKAAEVWQTVVEKFTEIKNAVVDILTGIGNFFKEIWDVYIGIWKFAIALIVGIVLAVFSAMGIDLIAVFKAIAQFFQEFWAAATELFNTSITAVKDLWNAGWQAVKDFFDPIWQAIKDGIKAGWDWIVGIFQRAIAPVSQAWDSMWERAKEKVTGVWESIKDTVKAGLNWVIDKMNWLINKANDLARSTAGKLGFDVPQIPTIPHLAKGGIVTRPTIALIGEAGPEAVVPLTGRNAAAAGMGGGITINFNGPVYGGEAGIRELGDALLRHVKRRMHVNI